MCMYLYIPEEQFYYLPWSVFVCKVILLEVFVLKKNMNFNYNNTK